MTLKEKVAEVEPNNIKEDCWGGVMFCPNDYDYLNEQTITCRSPGLKNCTKCWNQEYKECDSMADFKIRVVENIGEDSIKCFGEVETEFKVVNGIFHDLDGDEWSNFGEPFESLYEVNKYFGDNDCLQTVFKLVE